MSTFHCCFVGDDNRVTEFELLKVPTEEDAVRRAGEMLQGRPGTIAAELWQAGKFLTRVSGSSETHRT
jgi:hypothetical protein